jgi:hypothetical protein
MRTAREWLARDPLPGAERSQGPNLYNYVKNDPTGLVDPLGLWQLTIEGGDVLGVQFTIGNNGGSGLFNGTWSLGLRGGLGEGFAASLDPNDSGCKKTGVENSLRLDGTLRAGPVGVALTTDTTDLNGLERREVIIDHRVSAPVWALGSCA